MKTEPHSGVWERPLVLINRQAGSLVDDSPDACAARIRERFASHGVDIEPCLIDPETLSTLDQTIADDRPTVLVVGGGDGTISAGAVAAREAGLPLGVLPLGTFNHAARDLHVPLELDEAVDALVSGEVGGIDIATVNGRPFLCVCVLGVYPEKIHTDSDRGHAWWTKFVRYLGEFLTAAPDFERLDLKVKTESGTREVSTGFLAVSNNPYRDAPGIMPEKEGHDTGRLAVYHSTHRTLRRMAEAGMAFLAGTLGDDPDMHVEMTPRVAIGKRGGEKEALRVLVDGERIEVTLPLEFAIEPAGLNVILPKTDS